MHLIILMDYSHIIVIGLGVLVLFLIGLALFLIRKRRKPKGVKVNNEFIDTLISYYGGINNINSVEVENSRLKIEVVDLDNVNLESIKENSSSGVFVTGNIIKTLYKLSSDQIKKSLDQRLKEK